MDIDSSESYLTMKHVPSRIILNGLTKFAMMGVPQFVPRFDGFKRCSFLYKANGNAADVLLVFFEPDDEDGKGFVMIYLLELGGTPFKYMEKVWAVANKRFEAGKYEHKTFNLDDNGRLFGLLDFPSESDIQSVVEELNDIYETWRAFPFTDDFGTVKQLTYASELVDRLNHELEWRDIQKEIDVCLLKAKAMQERVAALEQKLNETYEEAADAINFLEEHGYKNKTFLYSGEGSESVLRD